MTKRTRDYTYQSNVRKSREEKNAKNSIKPYSFTPPKLVRAARGRLMGALLEVLEGESDVEEEIPTPSRRRTVKDSDLQVEYRRSHTYVLKLFDRSVDLSQFSENTPLYPICRAWIANQPKADYAASFGKNNEKEDEDEEGGLPGPEGPPVSRIPSLLPEQRARNKSNINLNYREAPPPSREILLMEHLTRWGKVRRAWLEQAAAVEARYEATQKVLDEMIMG